MWQQTYYAPQMPPALDGGDGGDEEQSYPLPPLPVVRRPDTINGIPTNEVYDAIRALKRELERDQSAEREKAIADYFMAEPKHRTMAIFEVLHQSGLLKTEKGEPVDLPTCPPPMLPPNIKSWIYRPEHNDAMGAGFVAKDAGAVVKAEVKAESAAYF